MHTTIMHKSNNAWVLAGTMFVHSKNACILHIAYCMGLKRVICIMRCDYIRLSTVAMGKIRAVIDVIQRKCIILQRFSLHAC
jgi:hypothetical protein